MSNGLTGTYRVRASKASFREVRKRWPRAKDRIIIRKHALKLRHWPDKHAEDEQGRILDLDWGWVKSLRGERVGELRVEDEIGGQQNIRIIFWVGPRVGHEMPIIWILYVFPKKRQEFTKNEISNFKLRKLMIGQRFYGEGL